MGTRTPYDEFQDAVQDTKDAWFNTVIAPLGSAYERARYKYLKKIEDQEGADRAAAESQAMLVMLALSLAGGSVLATMFGQASAKLVAADLAKSLLLKLTVRKGWERAFAALAWVDKSPWAKFVMGKLWDEAESRVTREVSDAIRAIPESAKLSVLAAPWEKGATEFQNDLQVFLNAWKTAVTKAGAMFDDWEGDKGLKRLKENSTFFKTPKQPLSKDKMADRMELAFWMQYLLGLDYLETGYYGFDPNKSIKSGYDRLVTSREPIDGRPGTKEYPKQDKFEFWDGRGVKRFYEVKYQRAGDLIRSRINEVNGAVYGGTFFTAETSIGSNVSKTTLRWAELKLAWLSNTNANMIQGFSGITRDSGM